MVAAEDPAAPRPMDEIVDVLIVGSGASGAAVAWGLVETRLKILCLEQGDWIKPTDFPANGRDWEARRYADFDISPNRRARETDYPVNDNNSVMKVANFNGVGGGTILFTAHFPRMHPSDFRVRTLDGVADDWPIDYWTLEPYFAENDRMMGVAGLAGDPAYPAHEPTMPPVPLGRSGMRYARALNKLGWHWWPSDISSDHRVRWPRQMHQHWPLHAGLRTERQGQCRYHLLAARRGATHTLSRARDHYQRARHGIRRDLLRPAWLGAVPTSRSRDPGRQRHRHCTIAPQFSFLALSERPCQLLGPGRQEPDAASVDRGRRCLATSRRRWTATVGRKR